MPKKIKIVGVNGPEVIKIKRGSVVLDNQKYKFFMGSTTHKAALRTMADKYRGQELFMKASNYFRAHKGSSPLQLGEFHYGQHNYLGPGTDLARDKQPFNAVDALAREHDLLPKSKINAANILMKLKKLSSKLDGYHVLREMLEKESR